MMFWDPRLLRHMGADPRLICLFVLLLSACEGGKGPFRMVQICLGDAQGVSRFVEEMKSIAKSENMEYVDGSANTRRGLDNIGYAGSERKNGSPLIHVGVERRDTMGVTAGNLGLPGYQVALGFSEGSNPAEARAFADRTVKRLSQRWKVEVVPDSMGAKPLPGCR
jgi:hypothetical protein